ncbi:4039_t:CDS:2, partial [Dentiscutata erythropus]
MKDKFNEVEHVEVDFVKGKATEFVQSEHIEVELVEGEVVEDETQESDDIEIDQGSISFESNAKTNTPVLGLEFEGLDLTKHHINQPIELLVGARFNSWAIAEHYVKEVEHHKSYSTTLNDRVKKRTYVCEKAGKYKPNKTKLLEQQRNKGSKKTDCKCHVNLSNPEASNFVHITFVDLEYNHILDADNIRFAIAFQKFDEFIMDEKIERAQAFLSDETQESYEWVLQQTLDATSFEPQIIMTDMDPAMDTACQLKAKLGSTNFKEFVCDFWKAQNSLSIEVFERQFQSLLEKYPSANKYLTGMQSTSRVESINAIIHKAVTSSSSMSEVVQALELRMQKEELNK